LLLESGVATWLVRGLLDASPMQSAASEVLVITSVSLVALTAHLYMPSHSARAAVLMPPLFALITPFGLDVTAVAFIATMGSNYCLTFPVSSKALQMYQEVEPQGFEASDLLRIGAVLLPLHLLLLGAFYFGYWRWVGLAL
jgi:predicted histidine transporter YuiF (NhaC family)